MPKEQKNPPKRDERPVRHIRVRMRDALIIVLSIIAGVAAAWLLMSAQVLIGQAVLGGFAAFGATLYFLERRIDD